MSTTIGDGLFSIPAMFIVLRETLEASIVCSVLLGVLAKVNLQHLNKYIWYGVAVGSAFTIAVLGIALAAFNFATEALVDEDGNVTEVENDGRGTDASLRLRAVLSISAGALVAYMVWTLDSILKKQKEIEKHVLNNTEELIHEQKALDWWTVFFLSGTAVAREGVETIVFLGVGTSFELKSIPLSLIVGFIFGVSGGIALYRAGNKVALERFFQVSAVFLTFIGAGIFSHGMEEIQQLTDYGLGWWSGIVYNISYCCGLRFEGWRLFRALLGYTPYPSRLEMIAYFAYHVMIICGFLLKWRFERLGIDPYKATKVAVKTKIYACLGEKYVDKDKMIEEQSFEALEKKIEEDLKEQKDEKKASAHGATGGGFNAEIEL